MKLTLASEAEFNEALKRYVATFPTDEDGVWMLAEFFHTNQCVEAMNKAVARGTQLTQDEVDKKYGPLSWDW